ncbi:MAG: NAD(P)/FAD-dependent oxidoreductase [Pirellula sp.]
MPTCDVAIIGAGPGGTTVASFLKKSMPQLDVCIIEKETFPRDHVGESQLPAVSKVLHEMGAWDKVEAARFPVKLGASYTWGKTSEPWVFGFIPASEIGSLDRPGKYEGWRQRVAFQVDRSKYDKILLDHAQTLGATMMQPKSVTGIEFDDSKVGKPIRTLKLNDGSSIEAKYYVDASGNAAVVRRQLGIRVDAPSLLKNVAFWDYWTSPGLNTQLLENQTIRVLIRSVPYGWIWYIALSQDRTSVGLVCNAEYYKRSGKRPEELYADALQQAPTINQLLASAKSTGEISAASDWSYVAEQAYGENWFLVGESLGFADPILAAGLTLTQTGAQHLAYTILDLIRGNKDRHWLLDQYQQTQTRRVRQHIKFAEYWYSANGLFSDILENCSAIAAQSGLEFQPQEAFRWLSHGGVEDIPGQFAIGGLGLTGIKSVQKRFAHTDSSKVAFLIHGMNTFELSLQGSVRESMAYPQNGEVLQVPVLVRDGFRLPLTGAYGLTFKALEANRTIDQIVAYLQKQIIASSISPGDRAGLLSSSLQCLESMVAQGWVRASLTPGIPTLSMVTPDEGQIVYSESKSPKVAKN